MLTTYLVTTQLLVTADLVSHHSCLITTSCYSHTSHLLVNPVAHHTVARATDHTLYCSRLNCLLRALVCLNTRHTFAWDVVEYQNKHLLLLLLPNSVCNSCLLTHFFCLLTTQLLAHHSVACFTLTIHKHGRFPLCNYKAYTHTHTIETFS